MYMFCTRSVHVLYPNILRRYYVHTSDQTASMKSLIDMGSLIERKFDELQITYGIHILFAIESGSRAWGFPSTDSDWDVRFVFVRPLSQYVAPGPPVPDTISWMSQDRLLDMVGWDMRKVLYHICKNNPSLGEWLQSPIVYRNIDNTKELLQREWIRAFEVPRSLYHYHSMACGNWRTNIDNRTQVKLKKYFYVLRPLLMHKIIKNEQNINTIVFLEVLEACKTQLPQTVYDEVLKLYKQKCSGTSEKDLIARNEVLDDWIRQELKTQKPKGVKPTPTIPSQYTTYIMSMSEKYCPSNRSLVKAIKGD